MEIPNRIEAVPEIDPQLYETILRGKDFEALTSHAVYKRITDWMDGEVSAYLDEMRKHRADQDDHTKANLLERWTIAEDFVNAFKAMVQQAINEKDSVIELIKENTSVT